MKETCLRGSSSGLIADRVRVVAVMAEVLLVDKRGEQVERQLARPADVERVYVAIVQCQVVLVARRLRFAVRERVEVDANSGDGEAGAVADVGRHAQLFCVLAAALAPDGGGLSAQHLAGVGALGGEFVVASRAAFGAGGSFGVMVGVLCRAVQSVLAVQSAAAMIMVPVSR